MTCAEGETIAFNWIVFNSLKTEVLPDNSGPCANSLAQRSKLFMLDYACRVWKMKEEELSKAEDYSPETQGSYNSPLLEYLNKRPGVYDQVREFMADEGSI